MTRRELINTVRTKIDEVTPLDSDVTLSEDKPVDTLIGALLNESAREVLMNAPAWRVKGVDGNAFPHGNKDGSGYVVLPEGFVRLLEFRMTEWERAVTEIAEEGSDVAVKQHNRYLRGGCCKPVCVYGHRPEGAVVEYYSVKKEHRVKHFVYAGIIPAEDIPVDLQDVLTWWCASSVFSIIGKSEESRLAYERGKSLL